MAYGRVLPDDSAYHQLHRLRHSRKFMHVVIICLLLSATHRQQRSAQTVLGDGSCTLRWGLGSVLQGQSSES